MSLGIFRSIRGSYGKSYRRMPDKMIHALNEELAKRGLPPYVDPDPDERGLRRLPCGNAGASIFIDLEKRAQQGGLPWTLGRLRGDREIALPISFSGTWTLSLGRSLLIFKETLEVCAVQTVHDELLALAPRLQIPLTDGALSEEIADCIDDCNPLPGEDAAAAGELENVRTLWLDLYFAAKYGLEDKTPIVIA